MRLADWAWVCAYDTILGAERERTLLPWSQDPSERTRDDPGDEPDNQTR